MAIKINDVVYQEKDIDQKPEPFYHTPEIYVYNDLERGMINKVRWIEDADLLVQFNAQLRDNGLNYYTKKALEYRANKFTLIVNKADSGTIEVLTDLQLSTLNDWVIVKNKIGATKKANVVNSATGLNEIIEVDDTEILRINTILTELVDKLTALDVKISNKIKTTSDDLAVAVFTMNYEQLDTFTMSIIDNTESILLMADNEFDNYINNLVQQILEG